MNTRDDAETTLQAAIALRPSIVAAREQIEQQRCLPPQLVTQLKEAGVFRMTMPRAWGGSELDPAAQHVLAGPHSYEMVGRQLLGLGRTYCTVLIGER